MHKFKVKFYLRPETGRKDGLRTVQVRIYLDGKRDYLTSSKVAVPVEAWNAGKEKVMLNTPEGRLMNMRLQNLCKQVTEVYLQHEKDDNLSIELIKQAYQARLLEMPGKHGVCTFFKQYIKENEDVISQDRHHRLLQVTNLFGQFISYTYNAEDIDFADVDQKMLSNFETHLCKDGGYTHSRTLKNKISILRSLFGAAHELGMTEQTAFDGYSPSKHHPVKADSLTIEEVKRIKKAEFSTKRLEKVRDCFLFSCHTGLSYQELKNLTKEHLTRLNGSQWILLGGDSPRYIPLLPFPSSIIEKYASDDDQSPLLPIISHQKTNLYLKEIAEICCIDKLLTFQLAVQTFMSIAMKSGATIDSVSHMVGKPLRQTEPFARFSPERIEEDMAMFAAKMGRDRPDT